MQSNGESDELREQCFGLLHGSQYGSQPYLIDRKTNHWSKLANY